MQGKARTDEGHKLGLKIAYGLREPGS